MTWAYSCSRYPQLQVGPRRAGLRFHDGRFETDNPRQAARLDGLPAEYGVALVAAPNDQRGDAGGGVGSGSGPDTSTVPARSARKADWVAHAAAVDPDATDLESLTKEQLIERYGSGDGQD